MNANLVELRKKDMQELQKEYDKALKEQFNLRMLFSTGEVRVHLIKKVRQLIAQIKTVMMEKQRQQDG